MPRKIDLLDKRFGKLLVVEYLGSNSNGKSVWKCQCDCGRQKDVISGNLVQGRSLTCGTCYKIPDLLGKVFGNLTVMEYLGIRLNGKNNKLQKKVAYWRCVDKRGLSKTLCTAELNLNRRTDMNLPKTDEDSAYISIEKKYKEGAKKRNKVYNLPYAEFKSLILQNCSYCNSLPNNIARSRKDKTKTYDYTGIDRVDNNLGYEMGNCVPCCIICNRAKSSMSNDKWLTYLKRLVEFRGNK